MGLQDTVDSIAARLTNVSLQLAKGFDEVRSKIETLEAQVIAGETPDFSAVNAALDLVSSQAQALDDVVPDAVSDPVVVPEVVEEPVVEEPKLPSPELFEEPAEVVETEEDTQ